MGDEVQDNKARMVAKNHSKHWLAAVVLIRAWQLVLGRGRSSSWELRSESLMVFA